MADPPAAHPGRDASGGRRAVIVVSALLAALSTAPYVRAALSPPPGTAFAGYFWYVDDAYNYLSYVQQAEDGAVLFRNKLVPEPHDGALLNPEWWLVGVVSRALGRRPILAYRLVSIAAVFALVAGIHRWLAEAGVPRRHALPALLLVSVGGGAAAFCLWAGHPARSCLDLSAGLFPIQEVMANPHFVVGTALLLWALRAFARAADGGPRAVATAAALGTLLALARPYDLVLLVGIRTIAVATTEPPARWPRQAAVMATLLPVMAYLGWVFYAVPAFAGLAQIRYVFPPPAEFAWALGPAALVALGAWILAWRRGGVPGASAVRSARAHLLAWLAIAAVMVVLRPVPFALQFLVGVGVPLLGLAAAGLAVFPPAATLAATVVLASTAAAAIGVTLASSPAWYVPAERLAAGVALRGPCRPGDVVLAPPDIGQYAGGFSACTPYVSHAGAPGFEERATEVRRFYEAPDPAAGALLADRICATHVVVTAARPIDAYLGRSSFQPTAVAGAPPRAIAVYSRAPPAACPGRR